MTIKVGDKVNWKGCFGMFASAVVKVVGMEVTEHPRDKYGEKVEEADVSLVHQNRVVFTLDNEKWAYSDQITPI